MTPYIPISATVVAHKLLGTTIPPEVELARRYPCVECGAPVGFSCNDTSERCWRARLLSNNQWRAIQKAYRLNAGGSYAAEAFLDRIYQGFNAMGMLHRDPDGAQDAIRKLRVGSDGKVLVEMIRAVLDARGDIPF